MHLGRLVYLLRSVFSQMVGGVTHLPFVVRSLPHALVACLSGVACWCCTVAGPSRPDHYLLCQMTSISVLKRYHWAVQVFTSLQPLRSQIQKGELGGGVGLACPAVGLKGHNQSSNCEVGLNGGGGY